MEPRVRGLLRGNNEYCLLIAIDYIEKSENEFRAFNCLRGKVDNENQLLTNHSYETRRRKKLTN